MADQQQKRIVSELYTLGNILVSYHQKPLRNIKH